MNWSNWCLLTNYLIMWTLVLFVWGKTILPRSAWVLAFRAELRPFAIPLFVVAVLADAFSGDGIGWFMRVVYSACAVSLWMSVNEKDDDDRWKRRRQKLADKVSEVGGRLVLVPATSPP